VHGTDLSLFPGAHALQSRGVAQLIHVIHAAA